MRHLKEFENPEAEKSYSFEELSPEAQRHALDTYRDINVEDDWYETVIDECTEDLEADGWEDIKINFTGFYSQGDGASFTGDVGSEGMWRFVNEVLGMNLPAVVLECYTIESLRSSSRYYHENSVNVSVDFDSSEDVVEDFPFGMEVPFRYNVAEIAEEIETKAGEWVKSRCRQIYNKLQEEYDAQQEDEAVKDTLLANDYEFDEAGNTI